MAKRITEYTNIETIVESDVLPIVDVSDTEQATTGSTRKGTVGKIADYIKDRAETLTNKILTTARLNTPKINEDVVLTATSTELNKITGMLDWFYPVGTIYETTSTNLDTTTKMANHFGGTWEAYGSGKVLVAKSADTEFDTIGETGGRKGNNLQVVTGGYGLAVGGTAFSDRIVVGKVGITQTSEDKGNLQPYIVVYFWKRTA